MPGVRRGKATFFHAERVTAQLSRVSASRATLQGESGRPGRGIGRKVWEGEKSVNRLQNGNPG